MISKLSGGIRKSFLAAFRGAGGARFSSDSTSKKLFRFRIPADVSEEFFDLTTEYCKQFDDPSHRAKPTTKKEGRAAAKALAKS